MVKLHLQASKVLTRVPIPKWFGTFGQKHFSKRQTTVKFLFYKLETKRKLLSNYKIQWCQGPPCTPFRTTMKTKILWTHSSRN